MNTGPNQPISHTTRPIVTGTSVLAIRTDKFVMMAADTLGSYGSLARFRDLQRIKKVSDNTLLGCGGEYSDFQTILEYLEQLNTDNYCYDDGVKLSAPEVHSYLTRICYNRRSRANPFYNQFAIGGLVGDKFYLGYTDLYGTTFVDNYVATGIGAHLGLPLLRKYYDNNLSIAGAQKLLSDVMKVLYYRDCRTINKVVFGRVDSNGVEISEPVNLDTNWMLKEINPIPSHLKMKPEDEESADVEMEMKQDP